MSKKYNIPYTLIPDLSTLTLKEVTYLVVTGYRDQYSSLRYEALRGLVKNSPNGAALNWFDLKLEKLYEKQRYRIPPSIERFKAVGYRWLLRGLDRRQTYHKLINQYEIAECFIDKRI